MKKLLISGVCGFVGAAIAKHFAEAREGLEIHGFDNLSRAGSWVNVEPLRRLGIKVSHADVRSQTDLDGLPECDWIIDAAANPSVLAGVSGGSSSRSLVETNLLGTINLLELCRRWRAGMILLSTSRVYALEPLCRLPLHSDGDAFRLNTAAIDLPGVGELGITENFSTSSPISLYGATKLASEQMALEYAAAFDFPLWINRCGVIGGAGQFARPDQGIFAFWLHSWHARRPLRYIGFGGTGQQVRDCLHPKDLALLIDIQMSEASISAKPRLVNVSGGQNSAVSLKQLSCWCESKWGPREVGAVPDTRQFDVPWIILDSSEAESHWGWKPIIDIQTNLDEIARFAESNPEWIAMSAGSLPGK